MNKLSERIDGIILDLDGTVYKGKQMIPGADEAIHYLRSIGKRIVFLSNRGNISRAMCRVKLEQMGIRADESELLLTSNVTAQYLRRHHPSERIWVLGEQGLRDEIELAGLQLAQVPEQAHWLVITLHETVTYTDLNMAFRAARSGAQIIATNTDRTFPGDDGDCIDVAGMIGAITSTTDAQVSVVIGKPSAHMSDAALQVLGVPPERCLVVGDSLASDIRMGIRAGMASALVLSGSTTREQAADSEVKPDYTWESLADILHYC